MLDPIKPVDAGQRSEAYQWARAFEAAFIGGNYAEAARLAGERNLLIPTGQEKMSTAANEELANDA